MNRDKLFKVISDFPNYSVSTEGVVFNNKSNKELTGSNSRGYRLVFLTCTNCKKLIPVHRLVAEAFIPKIPNKDMVNHKDGNKQNNNVDNLEWCTVTENNVHAHVNHLNTCELHGHWIICVETGKKYESCGAAEVALGKKRDTNLIYHCVYGDLKTAYGYHWIEGEAIEEGYYHEYLSKCRTKSLTNKK